MGVNFVKPIYAFLTVKVTVATDLNCMNHQDHFTLLLKQKSPLYLGCSEGDFWLNYPFNDTSLLQSVFTEQTHAADVSSVPLNAQAL